MATLFEMKKQRQHALDKAESLVQAAENAHREMTDAETLDYDTAMAAVNALSPQIKSVEGQNTIFKMMSGGRLITSAPGNALRTVKQVIRLSDDYVKDWHEYLLSRGVKIGAALYEGSDA